MNRLLIAAVVLSAGASSTVTAQAPAPDKVPIVAVAGCLAEQPAGTWLLTSATDPVPSIANAPPTGQPYAGPTTGKGRFQLIGTSEFDLPTHKGHTVLIKGLYVRATPMSRLNLTSVTMLATTCPPPAK
jgi:hypothetical protein